jgi:rod shape-determining protein MreD
LRIAYFVLCEAAPGLLTFDVPTFRPSTTDMPLFVRRALVGLALVLLQWIVFQRLDIFGAYPDAVLLFVAWIGLRHGRQAGSTAGFLLGFLMDWVFGTWGVNMFVKTLVGFVVGLFPASDRETLLIRPQQAFLGGLVVALLHNGIQVVFMAAETGDRSPITLTALWVGAALYTGFLAFLAALFARR